MYWIVDSSQIYPTGTVYQGDCAPGDRAASNDEVSSWQAAQAKVVPQSVSNFQARAQLYADNNFSAVDSAVRNSGNNTAIAAWDYANNFDRNSQFIKLLQAASPYNTPALVDDFFVRANKVV